MSFLLALLLTLFFAYAEGPLQVLNTEYQSVNDHPSCLMLNHRSIERKKVIRELEHIMGLSYDDPIKKIMDENTLINNKLFLGKDVWDDFSTLISFEIILSPEIKEAISADGLEQIYFSVQGPGLAWTAKLSQFPEDVEYQIEAEKIKMQYPLYLNTYCVQPDRIPQFSWFGADEVPESFQSSDQTSLQLQEALNK